MKEYEKICDILRYWKFRGLNHLYNGHKTDSILPIYQGEAIIDEKANRQGMCRPCRVIIVQLLLVTSV